MFSDRGSDHDQRPLDGEDTTDSLAAERLETIVAGLLHGDVDREALKTRHVSEMDAIDAKGLSSMQ